MKLKILFFILIILAAGMLLNGLQSNVYARPAPTSPFEDDRPIPEPTVNPEPATMTLLGLGLAGLVGLRRKRKI